MRILRLPVVFEIDPTGLTPWVDYVPVVQVADPSRVGAYDDAALLEVTWLDDDTDLEAWRDYTPVATLDAPEDVDRWRTNDIGYIPVSVVPE